MGGIGIDAIRRIRMAIAVVALAGCGGDSGDPFDLYPFWLETEVVVADVDGDGRADVLTLARYDSGPDSLEGILSVYRQASDGSFAAPESYRFGAYPWRMAIADVDGDGAPDIVVTDVGRGSIEGATWLLLQDAASRGRFLAAQRLPQSGPGASAGYDPVVADVDGDGVPDIVGGALAGGTGARVMIQDPSRRGTFQPWAPLDVPGSATSIAAGDLDGDGRGDLAFWTVIGRQDDAPVGSLAWRLRQPDGTLGPAQTALRTVGVNARRMAMLDIDGDARTDVLVFLRPSAVEYTGKLTSVIQGPAGAMTPIDTSVGSPGNDDAAFGDLDGDGRVDVAMVGWWMSGTSTQGLLTFYTQTGGGAFSGRSQIDVSMIDMPGHVAVGDLDGDGRLDAVVLGHQAQPWVVRQSHAAPGTFEPPRPLR